MLELFTALTLSLVYILGYMIMVVVVLFLAFSVPIGSVLLWDRISTARHRRREEAEKSKLAKAVARLRPGSRVGVVEKQRNICLMYKGAPYNHHNHPVLIRMEKIKKYVPPVAAIFFFLNLTGCKSDFEALVVSVYTLVFAVGLVILVLALAALWGLWKVVCWLRHIRK